MVWADGARTGGDWPRLGYPMGPASRALGDGGLGNLAHDRAAIAGPAR